ncbi:MAG: WG repeat-containing protein [Paludibacteraceae bacterium]|nr:WG repeat-containing protein [Paludibacteraceae bacterium]
MKKLSLYLLPLLLVSFAFFGCNDDHLFTQTPDTDKNLLWPACDSTGHWGFINEKGEMVIPATYLYAGRFSGERAIVTPQAGQMAVIDPEGNILYTFPENRLGDNYFCYGCCRIYRYYIYKEAEPVAMIDYNFNYIIQEDQYRTIGPMTKDGLVTTTMGYVDKKGKLVIPRLDENSEYIFTSMDDFCDGIAVVSYTRDLMSNEAYRCGAINKKGNLVIDTLYRSLLSVGSDRLLYQLDNQDVAWQYGLMDTRGNIITKPFINTTTFFGDGGLMPISDEEGQKWGYIDVNGEWRIPAKYEQAYPFCNGYAWVVDKYWKLIDLQGNEILTLGLQMPAGTLFDFHNGLCLVNDIATKQYQYINMKGEVIYSWPEKAMLLLSSAYQAPISSSAHQAPTSSSAHDEMMLRLFEGTEYYPLALQAVQRSRSAQAK